MAVLGVQVVITMVLMTMLHRVSAHLSLARWALTGKLIRYLHPSDDQLREMMSTTLKNAEEAAKQAANGSTATNGSSNGKNGNSKHRNKKHKGHHHNNRSDGVATTFKVPKNTEFVIEAARIQGDDLLQLKFYPEYHWLVDFTVCALMAFMLSEMFLHLLPDRGLEELNLSIVWCLLVVGFTMKMLLSLTKLYFQGEESIGERSICITAAGIFFLMAMVVLIMDEEVLELGLNPAYRSFNSSAYRFLEYNGVSESASGPLSLLLFKFWLALLCGLVGAIFVFPGLRFGQMHLDALRHATSHVIKVMLHLSFISPLIIMLLWVKPIARTYFTRKWISSDTFDSLRIGVIILVITLRVALMRKYLQSYLNLAPSRLARMRKEAGSITNVQLQKTVAGVFYYLCVVALQFLAPLLLLLFTAFLFKVLGKQSWTGSYFIPSEAMNMDLTMNDSVTIEPLEDPIPGLPDVINTVKNAVDSVASMDASKEVVTNLTSVFSPILFRGLFGFITWWMTTVWFLTSIIGFVYHSYYSV